MTVLFISLGASLVIATIGGLAGIVKVLEYLQANAKAQSDVDLLEKRVTALEAELAMLMSEKSIVEDERREALYQNGALIRLMETGKRIDKEA